MTQPDDALTRSREMRERYAGRTDVLDKVKALTLLPGGTYVTSEMVAGYFGVEIDAIKKVTQRSSEELQADGYRVIDGHELRDMKSLSGIASRAPSLALFPRRAVLRVAMLLRDSAVARRVRSYLLDAEERTLTVPGVGAVDITDPQMALLLGRMVQAQAAQAIEQRARAEKAEAVVLQLEPKAAQADLHRAADGLVAVGDFANKVKAWAQREHGVRVLHQEVWDFLADIGLIIRGNTVRRHHPTAFATERDFVRLKETEYTTATRGMQAGVSPRLTPAGEGWAWDRAVRRIAAHGSLKPTTDIERTTT